MAENWLDGAIELISPAAGLRRRQARKAMKIMASAGGYEGARRNRHTENWSAPGGSADADLIWDIPVLRDRARDVLRNNPFAGKGVEVIVSNAVSTGLVPRSDNQNWNRLWQEWSEVCDADGRDDFSGIQALVARTMIESGECLVRLRTRRAEDDLPVPLQLQVLEPDFIDDRKNLRLDNGGVIVNGIELDALGRRVAYWLFPEHPGAQYVIKKQAQVSQRVDARDVLHVFKRERPGQTRGVSWLAPVLLKLKYLQDYDAAELLRKKLEACFAIFVTNANEPGTLAPASADAENRRIEEIAPGMIYYPQPGEDVKFGQPSQNDGYGNYVTTQLRAAAAGLRVPYELLTGDLTQTNYSSYRGGMIPFRADCETYRWRLLVPQLCAPILRRFNDLAGIQYGQDLSAADVQWTAPRYEWVDPLKDITAEIMAVRAGLMSLPEAIARQGYDPDQLLREVAANNALLDSLDLVLDTDPRRTSQSGNSQAVTEAALLNNN